MKTTFRKIMTKFFTFLMIGVIAMLVVNKVVFMHVHKLSDGTIIEHAHPFDKNTDSEPFKSHHHSNAGFFFYENLNFLFLVLSLIIALILFFENEQKLFDSEIKYSSTCISSKNSRAPPILLHQYYNTIS
ncbi:MAG: hypothetical protein JEZ09_18275 [Salinivirgaceae bacterium]|nr:hypothetical protein [Salinivirgaceae bacterium]